MTTDGAACQDGEDGVGADGDANPRLSKRSFLRLPVDIDTARLLHDYESINERDWGVSHWDVHCSIDVLLLRGGTKQNEDDFTTNDIENTPILSRLPYLRTLVSPDGPFGDVRYAFIFRTKPHGVTRAHTDNNDAWRQTLRVHLPIVSNPDAVLLADGNAKHFDVGSAWTFDNQSMHGVVNGGAVRVHMIIDVADGPKRDALMKNAFFDPGHPDPVRWALTMPEVSVEPFLPFDSKPLSIAEKIDLSLAPGSFATRFSAPDIKSVVYARTMRCPIRDGDVVVSVAGKTESAVSRTAMDYIRHEFSPGATISVGVLRGGERLELAVPLHSADYWPLQIPRAAKKQVRSLTKALRRSFS